MEEFRETMIIFRADGNADIGAGHIMRCLSIADAALEMGKHSVFITASPHFEDIINQHGHKNEILDTKYTDMPLELNRVSGLLRHYAPAALIVDSYYVTKDYLNSLLQLCREIGNKLIYIDDVMTFAYPCDILINYNIYAPEREQNYRSLYSIAKRNLPLFLLGPKYMPLRSEFQILPKRKLKENVQNVLVSTGGSDPEHMNLEIIERLKEHKKCGEMSGLCFHFVIGTLNEDKKKIEEASKGVSGIVLHYNISNMGELMQSCDLAISAAGSTLYELCATQTPTNTYVTADNQIPGAESFEYHGVLNNCGDVRISSPKELAESLLEETMKLAKDYSRRARFAGRMGEIVDRDGAKRIVEFIQEIILF